MSTFGPLEDSLLNDAPRERKRPPTPLPLASEPTPAGTRAAPTSAPQAATRDSTKTSGRRADALPSSPPARLSFAARAMLFAVLSPLVTAAIIGGIELREWLWRESAPVRFRSDVENGYNWGTRVVSDAHILATARGESPTAPLAWGDFFHAYLALYGRVEAEHPNGDYRFDYPPLRLVSVALWARYEQSVDPAATAWRDELTGPMLWRNTVFELASALAAFFLVQMWVGRASGLGSRSIRAGLAGLIAAMLVWFNPAVLINAHAWPQWDVWLVAFYLAAALAISGGRPLLAGVAVGVACLFKGQILLVAPIFVLWPLFMGRPMAAIRAIVGFLATVALLASPWLVRGTSAWLCVGGFVIVVTLTTSLLVRAKYVPLIVALAIAGAIFGAASLWGGDWAWLRIGTGYGTHRYMTLTMGAASNLASLLGSRFGWNITDVAFGFDLPPTRWWATQHGDVTLRALLITVYIITLILCSIGAALQTRRRDPRLLIALATPWLLMFAILPQMHERYLIWAAAVSAICGGVGLGFTLLHVLITAAAMIFMLHSMLPQNPNVLPGLQRFINNTHPDIGWVVLLIAGIFLYVSVVPQRNHDKVTR